MKVKFKRFLSLVALGMIAGYRQQFSVDWFNPDLL